MNERQNIVTETKVVELEEGGVQTEPLGYVRIIGTHVLRCMAEEVAAINREKGWYDGERTFGDDIALLHSEVSEMLEAYRDHGLDELVRYTHDDGGGYAVVRRGDVNDRAWRSSGRIGKPEGVASEAADVLVRLLDTCFRYDIDLFKAWREKVDFNRTRPARHGGKRL